MTFAGSTGGDGVGWGADYDETARVSNIVPAEYEVTKITITDADGWEANEIIFSSPDNCVFSYPNDLGNSFVEGHSGSSTVYTAANVDPAPPVTYDEGLTLDEFPTCPVRNHTGYWSLEVHYLSSVSSATSFTKEFEVCFEWKE